MARILVVDDDPNHLVLAQVILSHEHETASVSTAGDALSRLREGGIDAMILDLMMPGVSGLDLALALREEPCVGGVPIMIWTACILTSDIEAKIARAVNIHSVLPKPCEPGALLRVVARMAGGGPASARR